MLTAHQAAMKLAEHEAFEVEFEDLAEMLGVEEDELKFPGDKVGKYRLQQFLRSKFGANYRNNSTAKAMLAKFDTDVKAFEALSRMRK